MQRLTILAAIGLVWLAPCATSSAQVLRDTPEAAKGIQVDQKIGQTVALEAKFHDEQNNYVALGDFFDGQKPVVMSFNFSKCPRLCIVQFNNFVTALMKLDLVPGRDFQIVSISLDPRDKPSDAQNTKLKYVAAYGNLESAGGWHFLVGNQASIEQAADACGIRYKYIPEQDTFSHPAAFIFCSPQGQIIRYLNGLEGNLNETLKPAIIEAGEGRVGGVIDRLMYFASCYAYDPVSGKYSWVAHRIMRIGAVLTVFGLLIGLAPYWIGLRRKKRAADSNDTDVHDLLNGAAHLPREVLP